jgi:hypothetical protein
VGLVQQAGKTAMILYHFTCVEYLESIRRDGLNRGDVPTRFKGPLYETNAVWFTTEPQPEGHGLSEAQTLTEEDRTRHFEIFGVLPSPSGERSDDDYDVRADGMLAKLNPEILSWPCFRT